MSAVNKAKKMQLDLTAIELDPAVGELEKLDAEDDSDADDVEDNVDIEVGGNSNGPNAYELAV